MLLLLSFLVGAHASPDTDGDGVKDKHDLCPSAFEDLDGVEDKDGCPDPDLKAELGPLTGFEEAVREQNAKSAELQWISDGWTENLVGGSGMTGAEVYRQATSKGWALQPDPQTMTVVGVTRMVYCDVWARKDERVVDAVWMLMILDGKRWKLLGGGESRDQVAALGESKTQHYRP